MAGALAPKVCVDICKRAAVACCLASVLSATATLAAVNHLTSAKLRANQAPAGFTALFNGTTLDGWKVPEGDNGHWKVVDGAIDCDAKSESKLKDKSLWTDKKYRDFVLRVDWRLKPDGGYKHGVPVILPSGLHKRGDDGKEVTVEIEDVDSGIYLRGSDKSQVNIWMWPIGSGEVYGYRTDRKMPAQVRAAVTPKKNADRPRGEWNSFEITMKGDRLWVKLNGEELLIMREEDVLGILAS